MLSTVFSFLKGNSSIIIGVVGFTIITSLVVTLYVLSNKNGKLNSKIGEINQILLLEKANVENLKKLQSKLLEEQTHLIVQLEKASEVKTEVVIVKEKVYNNVQNVKPEDDKPISPVIRDTFIILRDHQNSTTYYND